MDGFSLNERLAADTYRVIGLNLSLVLLMDDRRWPWLMLVPRRPGLREVHQLLPAERSILIEEIALLSAILAGRGAYKVNVGALGNVVPQLHVHVVGRAPGDPAWPGPVWGHGLRESYPEGIGPAFARELAQEIGIANGPG